MTHKPVYTARVTLRLTNNRARLSERRRPSEADTYEWMLTKDVALSILPTARSNSTLGGYGVVALSEPDPAVRVEVVVLGRTIEVNHPDGVDVSVSAYADDNDAERIATALAAQGWTEPDGSDNEGQSR